MFYVNLKLLSSKVKEKTFGKRKLLKSPGVVLITFNLSAKKKGEIRVKEFLYYGYYK